MTEDGDPWYSRPGIWFWLIIALGVVLRVYLVVFTEGTYDVGIWGTHASGVGELGLVGYYHTNPSANHPPFILEVELLVWRATQFSGIPWRVLLRAPFALLDAGTTFLLFLLLGLRPWRLVLTAAYWINPLSLIFSAYQGNTDSAVAFFLLLAVWFLSKERIAAAAITIGLSLWIKLPGILAIPAFLFCLPGWRRRLFFLSASAVVAVIGYLPALIQDANVLGLNVFGYHGRLLQTAAGTPAWGARVLLFSIIAPAEKWPAQLHAPILFFLRYNWQIALFFLLLASWLRRSCCSVPELCATIAIFYAIIYGFSDYWAFQYFAWSLPFWFFLRPWFFIPAILLASAYIYSLYWTLCGNGWLLGIWDFAGHLYWPTAVIIFRNLAVLFFFVSACAFLIAAIYDQINAYWRSSPPAVSL